MRVSRVLLRAKTCSTSPKQETYQVDVMDGGILEVIFVAAFTRANGEHALQGKHFA